MFGVKGGINISNLNFSDKGDYHFYSRFDFSGGIWAEYIWVSGFGFRPEITYSPKGGKFAAETSRVQWDYRFNYVDIPLLVTYRPTSWFMVGAGPQLSFKAGSNYRYNTGNGTYTLYDKLDASGTDFGFAVGCGLIAARKVEFYLRYSHGLSDIKCDKIGGKVKNSYLQFGAAFVIFDITQ